MEYIFIVLLLLILAYIVYRNFGLFSKFRNNKEYINCYQKMLDRDADAYDSILTYIQESKKDEFKNKGRILQVYSLLDENKEYKDALNELDIKPIFCNKDKLDKNKFSLNTDVFVWLYMLLAKARSLSKFDIINELYVKLTSIPSIEEHVEYQLFKAIYNALLEKEDGGVKFLNDMLEGRFTDYVYDKTLIGMFKRFAASTLAYCGEPLEEYYQEDLPKFAASAVGRTYLKDLGIYDKYLPLEKI